MSKKCSLIIGGTKGIGFSVARQLARHHRVYIIGREKPTHTVKNLHYFPGDLLNAESIYKTLDAVIEDGGKLNYLLFFQRYRGAQESWSGELQVSLTATKQVIEYLSEKFASQEASIVLISSINASMISGHLSLGYHIAKAGLVQMARYYAIRLGPKGIRVNSLSLGTILKEESKKFLLKNRDLVSFHKYQAPLRRMGTTKDVANVVGFLCSSKSSFITGQDIVMNGGVSLQWQETLAMEKVTQ